MRYDPDLRHRRSIRLNGYDYSQAGAYFVTICTQDRGCLFGDIVDGEMRLNDAGRMVAQEWAALPTRFLGIDIDAFVIMPNHLHGILLIVGAPLVGAQERRMTLNTSEDTDSRVPTRGTPTLGDLTGAFKSLTTNAYIRGVKQEGWPPFNARLWQRNYFERIIRDEKELDTAREYVARNPGRWAEDKNNPARLSGQENPPRVG